MSATGDMLRYRAVFLAEKSGADGRVAPTAVVAVIDWSARSMKETMEALSRNAAPDMAGREVVEVHVVKL